MTEPLHAGGNWLETAVICATFLASCGALIWRLSAWKTSNDRQIGALRRGMRGDRRRAGRWMRIVCSRLRDLRRRLVALDAAPSLARVKRTANRSQRGVHRLISLLNQRLFHVLRHVGEPLPGPPGPPSLATWTVVAGQAYSAGPARARAIPPGPQRGKPPRKGRRAERCAPTRARPSRTAILFC